MQSESHEIFALGLTTSSATANEDGHKKVIKDRIAAINDKLVNAQQGSVGQNHEANNDKDIKAAAIVVPFSPPEPTIPKMPSSQQCNSPAKVDHAQARQTLSVPFQQGMGMGMFRANEGQKQKQGRKRQQNKHTSKTTTDNNFGMRAVDVPKASASPQPIVWQQPPIRSLMSPAAGKQPYGEDLITLRGDQQRPLVDHSPAIPKHIQPGCRALQASVFDDHLKTTSASSFESKLDWRPPRRISISSGQDGNMRPKNENTTSPRRPPSQISERTSSNPPSFVHLSELSLSRSSSPDVDNPEAILLEHPVHEEAETFTPDMFAMHDIEGFSFTEYLNDGNSATLTYFAASQSTRITLLGNAAKTRLSEPEFVPISDLMDLDSPL